MVIMGNFRIYTVHHYLRIIVIQTMDVLYALKKTCIGLKMNSDKFFISQNDIDRQSRYGDKNPRSGFVIYSR